MRSLSPSEKEIILKIYHSEKPVTIVGLICNVLANNVAVKIDVENNEMLISTPRLSDFNEIERHFQDKCFPEIQNIVSLISFLNYLQLEGYIHIHKFQSGAIISTTLKASNYIEPPKTELWHFPEDEIKTMIFTYISKSVYSSSALHYFIKNKFRTEEQVRHDQNMLIAKIGIGVSIVLGLVAIFK